VRLEMYRAIHTRKGKKEKITGRYRRNARRKGGGRDLNADINVKVHTVEAEGGGGEKPVSVCKKKIRGNGLGGTRFDQPTPTYAGGVTL